MTAGVLVDTNVLLRLDDPAILDHLRSLRDAGHALVTAPQCIAEAWVVATRPLDRNGLEMSADDAARLLDGMERVVDVRPEPAASYATWRRIVRACGIVGVRAHDARLAAFAADHGLEGVVTLNPSDFVEPARRLGLRVHVAGTATVYVGV